MTTQTNQYADLRDILGLRFQCKKCQSVISLPPSQIIGRIPHSCVNCEREWSPHSSREVSEALEMLLGALRTFQRFNDSPNVGFSFSLELTGDGAKTLPVSRASDSKA
jgi:hypothetical protein